MTLTVTTLQSTDSDAPTLTGEEGSAIAFFDATLLPLGWTKEFTGTNVAAYRNSVSDGGSGCYVRIDDNSPDSNGERAFSIQVFSEMTDVDTGSNATGEVFFRKSSTLDATARPWYMLADGLTFYLNGTDRGDTATRYRASSLCGAGDYKQDQGSGGLNYFCFGNEGGGTASHAEWGVITPRFSNGVALAFYARSSYNASGSSLAMPRPLGGASAFFEGNLSADLSPVTTDQFFNPAQILIEPNILPGAMRGAYLAAQRMETGEPATPVAIAGADLVLLVTNATGNDSSDTDDVADGACGFAIDTAGPW